VRKCCLGSLVVFLLSFLDVLIAKPTILIDGSSTVFPISEGIAEEFQLRNKQYRVAVASSGTGGGFKKFCKGEVDVVGASRPIEGSEIELCGQGGVEFVELPIAYDGIALIVNPQNSWAKTLTTAELKKIWEPQSKVRTWQEVRSDFPPLELNLFGPGPDSGTFDYFTKVINQKEKSSRSDFSASESDFVIVKGVAGDRGSLGYVGVAYYESNKSKLKLVGVDSGAGAVLPGSETIQSGRYSPLSRPLFIYVSSKSLNRSEVAALSKFYVENAAQIAGEVGYVSLGSAIYQQVLRRLQGQIKGSIFYGAKSQKDQSVAELLKKSESAHP